MSAKKLAPLLNLEASVLRRHILDMAFSGRAVHIGCAFSLVEVLAVVYAKFLKFNRQDQYASDADRLVLSKGHGVMAQYACMREIGWLEDADIRNYFANGSKLRGLAEEGSPGIDVTCGSLGHGLPIAVGMALGSKIKADGKRIYCIVGDGELNEGSMWEAVMIASQHRLSNLTIIVDMNGFQAMGKTAEVLDMHSLKNRFEQFGLKSLECDGHDQAQLEKSLSTLLLEKSKPQVLVAKTVKGKGVSFMENNNVWHYTRLTPETYKAAILEIEA